jgi:dolichyl-phosphate-mannose--protein O-mannosyl transferase
MNFYSKICPRPTILSFSLVHSFQGQYFSGGNYRIYLLGNPIVWWSNLAFLAMFLLTYFIAAIKRQRGYDADEELEAKSE